MVCGCLFFLLAGLSLHSGPRKEYEVKAAFLVNFTKFVDWPTNSYADSNAPLVVGILGQDPFGQEIDNAVNGELAHGRSIVVKRLRIEDDLRSCHVLFICSSVIQQLPTILNRLKGSPVLTVSDVKVFAQQGGMFNLFLVNETVKIEINRAAAEQAGLQVSSKLLQLSRLVKPGRA